MNPIPTAAVVIFEKNKVLLVKHVDGAGHLNGTYGLPSGTIEVGEEAQSAAKRELIEETGLVANQLMQLPTMHHAEIERKDGTKKLFSMIVFLSTSYAGQLLPSIETIPEWVNINEINSFNLLPNTKEAILEAMAYCKEYSS